MAGLAIFILILFAGIFFKFFGLPGNRPSFFSMFCFMQFLPDLSDSDGKLFCSFYLHDNCRNN